MSTASNNTEETNSTATTIAMEEAFEIENTTASQLMQASSERLEAAFSEKDSLPSQESDIGLEWLKLGGASSTGVMKTQNPPAKSEQNLRIQLYQPPKLLQAIVEESKIGIVLPISHQTQIAEPKVEVVCDIEQKAFVLEHKIQVGTVTESISPPVLEPPLLMSDDDGDQSNKDTYESFEETNDTPNCPSLLPAVDSRCCTNCVRERETQTSKAKTNKRDRVRILINGNAQDTAKSSNVSIAGHSSDCVSSEPPRKLVIKTQNQSTFKQRQLDLHRHKILVEQRRLELLELKIARERDEMLRDTILYEKELEIKTKQLRKITDDRLDDI